MAKRKITANAKDETTKISMSISIEIDGPNAGGYFMDQQIKKVKRFKNALYEMLSGFGYHYDDIRIK